MKKFNKFLYIGLFFNLIWIISKITNLLPNLFEFFFIVIGITLILISLISKRLPYFKSDLFNKLLK